MAEPVYGAPPLVNEQLALGRIDAALTFWPYAARLDARGFTRLMDMKDVIGGLGISPAPPLVGFVWNERIMKEKGEALAGFFRAAARGEPRARHLGRRVGAHPPADAGGG